MGLSPSAFDELKEYERMNDLSAMNSITIDARSKRSGGP
jgi:hypothetical protein